MVPKHLVREVGVEVRNGGVEASGHKPGRGSLEPATGLLPDVNRVSERDGIHGGIITGQRGQRDGLG